MFRTCLFPNLIHNVKYPSTALDFVQYSVLLQKLCALVLPDVCVKRFTALQVIGHFGTYLRHFSSIFLFFFRISYMDLS
jgi:hypothetical protein